ncbi:MerR family transcriptional regulator [Thermosynechococcus sp. HN-54]|uniref:MerR family transcriptional regulator n=1 Tax=Thermosynechococcus sp. HN-54 TaxID=2933959 RepID=UPI00202CD629|nr:MerR family transcriptional regulator [Thermosynechococcus sp. HN-54]URR36123.1 MerR family transcriptional regulator [Thermosynechococcus sp. HN-54]
MATIQDFIHVQDQWSLDELVEIANELLPQHLPQEDSKNRVLEEVNPRLVRHYTSCKLIDRPARIGREGRYGYRHLLQLLVVRRLLMEGYTAGAIYKLVYRMSTPELRALLEQGVHLQLNPPPINPALAFLQQVQDRSEHRYGEPMRVSPSVSRREVPPPSHSQQPESWKRIEVVPGFEVHIRDDFNFPQINRDQEALVKQLVQLLSSYTQR